MENLMQAAEAQTPRDSGLVIVGTTYHNYGNQHPHPLGEEMSAVHETPIDSVVNNPSPYSLDLAGENLFEQPITPEVSTGNELVGAVTAINSVGATAMSSEVVSPAVPNTEPGFIGRRWQSIKNGVRGMSLLETPAAQAAIEAGETFSKWDAAKATVSQLMITPSQLSNVLLFGAAQPFTESGPGQSRVGSFANRVSERAVRKLEQAHSGVDNLTLRGKMASAIATGGAYNSTNPVQQHLRDYSRHPAVRQKVERRADWIARSRERPELAQTAQLLGGFAIGLTPVIARALGIV
jgi:hypothetical protein